MRFALLGEQVVGPGALALAHGICCSGGGNGGIGGAIPILGRIGNSPHIAVVVERHTDKKIFSVGAERQAGCHAGRNASAVWQIVQQYRSFKRQGLGGAESAALSAHYQSYTL